MTSKPMTTSRTTHAPDQAGISRSFPEAAAALRARSGGLPVLWQQAVHAALPSAEPLTRDQLRDHIPSIVDQILEALQSSAAEPAQRPANGTPPQAGLRFHQQFKIDELLIEYQLLRATLFDEVSAELGRSLTHEEQAAMNGKFDAIQRNGVTSLVEHLSSQLRAADELQSNYMSYLNHELRGGMNGILLMVEVIKRELASERRFSETVEDLDSVRRAVLDSVSTMDRFVYAHRLGTGKQQVQLASFNLHALATEILGALKSAARDRSVEMSMDIPENCSLDSDRDLTRLILYNSLGNAIKHAPPRGTRVNVTARQAEAQVWEITITDFGAGIAPGILETIFSPHPPSTGAGRQTIKLGLKVSKMAADLIGATLSIRSEAGTGTTVRLYVPARSIKSTS